MKTIIAFALALGCAATLPVPVQGQLQSPRDSVSLNLDTNRISIGYGRPSMRGRKIMGDLVPWNKVWRTGANAATHLTTSFDMVIGGMPLPRGNYTFWTLPSPSGWTFIVNKQTGQWGTHYDEGQDFGRFKASMNTTPAAVETLTISLKATGETSGVLTLSWENTVASTTFEKSDHIRPISPGDSTSVMLNGALVKIIYSRPFMRGRTIWGAVVPMDSIWRTGANNATVLSTETDLDVNKLRIPKGTYTLYSLPTEKGFTLIVSKKPPGSAEYDKSQDLVRIEMHQEKASSIIDPFTIRFGAPTGRTTELMLGWGDRMYTAEFAAHE